MGGFLDPTFVLGLGPNQFPRQIERLLGVVEGHSVEIDALRAEVARLKARPD